MTLIFCLSNLFIPETLTLICNSHKHSVLIYTDQEGIFEFFKCLHLDNVTIYFQDKLYPKTNFYAIYKFFKERKRILKELCRYCPDEIYFFHNTFGSLENWLLKNIQNKIIVSVYHVPIFNKNTFNTQYSYKAFKGVLVSLFFYGIRVIPLFDGKRYIYKLPDSFFIKIKANQLTLPTNQLFIRKVIDSTIGPCNKSIVLLTGSIVESDLVDELEYTNKINTLINKLGIDNVIAKPHPRYPNRFGLENSLSVIPSFIPANVLFSKYKIFIGYHSTTLPEAANEGLTAISLLEYFKPVSNIRKNNYKNYLLTNLNNGDILFPTQIESSDFLTLTCPIKS